MAFETLPVVHLERGRFPEYPDRDPEGVLTDLARRFGRVVLVDAHGVRANDADLEFVQAAGRKRPLWVDAGSRFATDAMDLFIAGADAVTMRWNTLDAPFELEEAATLCQPGSLFVGLEYPKGRFLPHRDDKRSAEEVVRFAERHGIGIVFHLDDPSDADLRALPTSATSRFLHARLAPTRLAPLEGLAFHGALLPADSLGGHA